MVGIPLAHDPRESERGRAVAEHLFSERPYSATTFVVDERSGGCHLLAGREWGRSRYLAGVFLPRDAADGVWVRKSGFLEAATGDLRNFNLRLNYQATEGALNLQEVLLTRTRFRRPSLRLLVDLSNPEHATLAVGGRQIGILNYRLEGNQLRLSGEALDRFLGMGGPAVSQATVRLPDVSRLPPGGRIRAMRLLQRTISGLTLTTTARFGNPIGWTESVLKSKGMPGVVTVIAIGLATLFSLPLLSQSDTLAA
ncbi:MAG: hypothetical protein HYY44_06065 [Deltaproteobacteria bacterium]|nr:hypothetical protein [Deltaproteobacteria bacterium]MBI4374019.1 hypothetical protein [Deltaproteobacteria bacterium]